MPEKKDAKAKITPSHEFVPDERARDVLGVRDDVIVHHRITELANLIWRRENMSEEQMNILLTRAIEHFNSLEPSDGAEGMLAQQMVGTHFAALECLRRAALPNQTFEGRDMALKHAHKLMTLYARQLDTLNKHRGKGQQKVTVEHVHVAEGGQAIVGTVETGAKRPAVRKAPELAHEPDTSVPLEMPQEKKVRQRKRS